MSSRKATSLAALPLLLLLGCIGFEAGSAGKCSAGRTPEKCPHFNITRAAKDKADLKVLVPDTPWMRRFVNCADPARVHGFCIDVFEAALSVVSPSATLSPTSSVNYTCYDISESNYDAMVALVATQDYDVVVGDITIAEKRMPMVDFTHKYMESGMVVISKVAQQEYSPWLFFAAPFSKRLWAVFVGAFVATGLLICFFEWNDHPEFAQGNIFHRFINIVWFIMEALVLLEKESFKSGAARGLMMAWLFFLVLLGASYTAGLSSFLTASNLSPSTADVISLRESGLKIGVSTGSIVIQFLTERFRIPLKQIVTISMYPDVAESLLKGLEGGGVAAFAEERPYAPFVLSALSSSSCDFSITSSALTKEGFGFGFNKAGGLEHNFSIALMHLTEVGCLRELHNLHCMDGDRKCPESNGMSSKVTWKNSASLAIPMGVCMFLSIIVHYVKLQPLCRRTQNKSSASLLLTDDVTLSIHPSMSRGRRAYQHIELQHQPY